MIIEELNQELKEAVKKFSKEKGLEIIFKDIIDTEPGLKGDTVSNTLKPAKIESGKEIQVPIFINIGDTIKIDTRDGSYVSRNNE